MYTLNPCFPPFPLIEPKKLPQRLQYFNKKLIYDKTARVQSSMWGNEILLRWYICICDKFQVWLGRSSRSIVSCLPPSVSWCTLRWGRTTSSDTFASSTWATSSPRQTPRVTSTGTISQLRHSSELPEDAAMQYSVTNLRHCTSRKTSCRLSSMLSPGCLMSTMMDS